MFRFVFDTKEKKDSKSVLKKVGQWETLRLQPVKILELRILIQILNAIWMAYRRQQKSEMARVWIVAEPVPALLNVSQTVDRAKRLCEAHFPLVESFGLEICVIEESERYMLFRNRNSRKGEWVVRVGVLIKNTNTPSAKKAREILFRKTKLLPEGVRGKAQKKKARKRKKQ